MSGSELDPTVKKIFYVLLIIALIGTLVKIILFNSQDTPKDLTQPIVTDKPIQDKDSFVSNLEEGDLEVTDNIKLSTDIEDISTETNQIYRFRIMNVNTAEATLTHITNQPYNYTIKDTDGTPVYTYSDHHPPTTLNTPKVAKLSKDEEVSYEVDITEALNQIEEGYYVIEIFSTAEELSTVFVSMTFSK